METNSLLTFNRSIGKQKRLSKVAESSCPFCDVGHLTDIYDQQGEMIFLKNKYPTLEKTDQFVLIESAKHDGNISNYEPEEWQNILAYAIKQWKVFYNDPKYKSVLLYKNYGKLSGGSLSHPHMQIVGLLEADGYREIAPAYFSGDTVATKAGATLNISDHPIMGFLEFNISFDEQSITPAADYIKEVVSYLLADFNDGRCEAYNLFFYKLTDKLYCKVVPRFIVSPYFVGYFISQKFDAEFTAEVIKDLKEKYLN